MYNILWADFLPSFDVVHVDQVICWLLVGSKVAASFYMVLWVVSHMGCRVSMEGFKWLLKDITYCILWTDVVASCQKLGIILENKVIFILDVIKTFHFQKMCSQIGIPLWKKIRKLLIIFDVKK